ncbi:hypothetical protein [Streptomyces sp. NPDC003077]|uniref:hypothetical protein n=1 Tax=Streptomyces sp. NPDC003077 TaxID=3154443 RepID=UPI0033B2982D
MVERSPRDPRDPLDEEAAWAEIVAGYGEQPDFPTPDDGPVANLKKDDGSSTGPKNVKDIKDFTKPPAVERTTDTPATEDTRPATGTPVDGPPKSDPSTGRPVGSFIVFAPGVGPRDWEAAEASDDDFDETDEGHFVQPDPPLPQADVTSKFAWLAVLGGPLLLVLMVLFRQPITWWVTVLGIGGFLGGFATLIARMKSDDEDDEDLPGGGAVV